MTEHTKGRIWLNAEQSAIVHSDDGRIACPPNHSQRWAWPENARRLVACWNACDGIETESLEEGDQTTSVRLMHQIRELRIQRDELLKALQHIQRCIPLGGFAQIHHGSSTWEQIDAAIAKAGGAA